MSADGVAGGRVPRGRMPEERAFKRRVPGEAVPGERALGEAAPNGRAPGGRGRPRGWWRWLPWLAMVVVVAGFLAVGTHSSSRTTLDQRVASLAGQVRCPVCDGETAAESDTPPSVEIRALIRQSLQAGQTTGQIKSKLVGDYGTGILEAPPARGVDLVVWVLPIVVVLVSLAGLGLAFRNWRGRLRASTDPSDDDRERVERALAADPAGNPRP